MNMPMRKDFRLNQGRIIPAENVSIVEPPVENVVAHQPPSTVTNEGCTAHHKVEVILLKDGERVKSIVIKCKCGEVISLNCEY